MTTQTKKPKLKLVGQDGNAFNLLGLAQRAGRKAGWDQAKINEILKDAMSGDYNNLLRELDKYFEVS